MKDSSVTVPFQPQVTPKPHFLDRLARRAVHQRLGHANPVGQSRFDRRFGFDQEIIAFAVRLDVKGGVAALPADAIVVDHAVVAAEPRHAIAKGMDRVAADQLRQRAAEKRFGSASAQLPSIGTDRFDPPIGADQKQQCAGLNRDH